MKRSQHYPILSFQNGFTIIEIVVAIVVVAILSAVVIGRFLGPNEFNGIIVRDQIVSMTRIAQQASLGRADVSLTITPNVAMDELPLEVSEIGGVVRTSTIDMNGVTLSGDINKTDSCLIDDGDTAITSVAAMTINFDELGDLEASGVTGFTGAITSSLRVCVNNEAVESVCVSPAGFAYPGVCDDGS